MIHIRSVDNLFWKYVLSSMITMFLQSAYSIVDGLIVSNFVNDTALAAINVSWPIIAVITAIGTGIGCSGAVIMSTQQGAGHKRESNIVRGNVILALLAAGLLFTAASLVLLEPLLQLMGARDELLGYAVAYGRIMLAGGTVQVLSCGLTPLLRNENRAVSAMVIMVTGFFLNLVLCVTFLEVFHWGIEGAAAAAICAQLFTVIACLVILIRKEENPLRPAQLRPQGGYWPRIFFNAVSPFGISLTPSLLILYHNIACMNSGSPLAVGAYALITSTVGSYRILLIGVADGIQPLSSFAFGARDYAAVRRIRNKSILTAVTISMLLFLFTLVTARFYPPLYGYTGDAAELSYRAVMLTSAQLIFTGLVRVTNSFFYAVGKIRYSLFMIYFDPLVMTPLVIAVLPQMIGLDGIWLTAVLTQLFLNIVAVWMFIRHERELRRLERNMGVQNLYDGV